MSDRDHPFKDEAWVQEVGPDEYYRSRKRGNWFILLALLAFIAFTVGMTVWKWDSAEFMNVTYEHEARREQLDAQRETQERTRELEAANVDG